MDSSNPKKSESMVCEDAADYDAWFRDKVRRAMAATEPSIPHDVVMAELQAIIDKHKPN